MNHSCSLQKKNNTYALGWLDELPDDIKIFQLIILFGWSDKHEHGKRINSIGHLWMKIRTGTWGIDLIRIELWMLNLVKWCLQWCMYFCSMVLHWQSVDDCLSVQHSPPAYRIFVAMVSSNANRFSTIHCRIWYSTQWKNVLFFKLLLIFVSNIQLTCSSTDAPMAHKKDNSINSPQMAA